MKIEPVVLLLTILLIFFTGTLFLAEWWFKADGQFYQTIAGLVTGIGGALLLRITGHTNPVTPPQLPQIPQVPQLPQVPVTTEVKP